MSRLYSVEVFVTTRRAVKFRIVNTGIGWVALASGDTLEAAMREARNREPGIELVLHNDTIALRWHGEGGFSNGDTRTDAQSREEQYATAMKYVRQAYPGEDTLHEDIERAMRLAWPVRKPLVTDCDGCGEKRAVDANKFCAACR